MHGCLVEIGHPGQIEVFHGIDNRADRRHGAGQQKDEQTSHPLHRQASGYRRLLATTIIGVNNFGVEGCS